MEVLIYRQPGAGRGAIKDRLELDVLCYPTTVGEVLQRLAWRCGVQSGRFADESCGWLKPGITVAVNRRDIANLQGLDTIVGPNDEVAIQGDLPWAGEQTSSAERRVALRFYGPAARRLGLEAGAKHEVAVEGEVTLRAVLERFSAGFGVDISNWLLDPQTGDLRPFIRIAVNGSFLDRASGLDSVMAANGEVMVMEFVSMFQGG